MEFSGKIMAAIPNVLILLLGLMNNTAAQGTSESPSGLTTYPVDVSLIEATPSPGYKFLRIYLKGADNSNVLYLSTLSTEQPFLFEAIITSDGNIFWDSTDSLKNACDDSFPEGTVESIVYDLLNEVLYNGHGCDIPEGSEFHLRSNYPYKMEFQKPVPCGEYDLIMNLMSSDEEWLYQVTFRWTIPEGSDCLDNFEKF